MQQMDIKNILQYPRLNCKILLVMPQILKQYNTYIRKVVSSWQIWPTSNTHLRLVKSLKFSLNFFKNCQKIKVYSGNRKVLLRGKGLVKK